MVHMKLFVEFILHGTVSIEHARKRFGLYDPYRLRCEMNWEYTLHVDSNM